MTIHIYSIWSRPYHICFMAREKTLPTIHRLLWGFKVFRQGKSLFYWMTLMNITSVFINCKITKCKRCQFYAGKQSNIGSCIAELGKKMGVGVTFPFDVLIYPDYLDTNSLSYLSTIGTNPFYYLLRCLKIGGWVANNLSLVQRSVAFDLWLHGLISLCGQILG